MAFAYTKLMQAMSEVGIVKDPDFEYVTLLLPGNGTNGAQNNTFLDSSTNNFTITRNGNTTQGTFSPYGDNWSNYFDGTGDNLALTGVTAVGNSNATVEFFIFPTDSSVTYRSVFDSRSTVDTDTGFGIFQYGLTIEVYGNGLKVSSAASALTINRWNHVAITRSSGTCQIYINGSTSGSSATYSSNLTSTAVRIADSVNTSSPYVGYISNLRVVVGSVVYSGSTYTVPTAPLTAITNTSLLTCQSNRFIDNSTNAFAITVNGNTSVQRFSPFSPTAAYSASTIGGSGYFDGTGDYLNTASNTWTQLSTGNFTVEGWAYINSYGTYFALVDARSVTGFNPWILGVNSNGYADFFYASGGRITDNVAVGLNTWVHLAAVRNGSTITLYVNGVSKGTATYSSSINGDSSTPSIGRLIDPVSANGCISNLRVVIGTAVYTAAFTPPSAPVTAITNTQLLLNFTNAGIIDNAMMNDLETLDNAQISTTQSKFGGSSMYFDGTGDYLKSNAPSGLALYSIGSGQFTIEMWIYRVGNGSGGVTDYDAIIGSNNSSASVYGVYVERSTLKIGFYIGGALYLTSSTISANTWTHIAVARDSSNNMQIFINGTSGYSATNTGTSTLVNPLYIGQDGTPSNHRFYGYIDDLRITKGVARYTANFTAPTAAFPTS